MPRSLPSSMVLLLLGALSACGEPPKAQPKQEVPSLSLAMALASSDARQLSPLKQSLKSSDLRNRRRSARALSQFGYPSTLPLLKRALRDPDKKVSEWAALGFSLMPASHHDAAESALIGSWIADPTPLLLVDLGLVGGERSLPIFETALGGDDFLEACEGLRSVLSRVAITPAIIKTLTPHMGETACVEAVAASMRRASKKDTNPPAKELVDLLQEAMKSPNRDIRWAAIRSLGRHVETAKQLNMAELLVHEKDRHVRIALVASIHSPDKLSWAIDTQSNLADPDWILLQALFDRGQQWAAEESVYTSAAKAQQLFKRTLGSNLSNSQAWAYCELSELMDRGRSWPSRVLHCPATSEAARKMRAAQILGSLSGAVGQRLVFLKRLWGASPQSDVAVVEALTKLLAETMSRKESEQAKELVALALKAHRPALTTLLEGVPSTYKLRESEMTHAFLTLNKKDDLEGLQSWIKAASDRKLCLGEIATLTHHWNLAVKRKARKAARRLGVSLGQLHSELVPDVIEPPVLEASLTHSPTQAVLHTSGGQVVLKFKFSEAPTTVLRFTELAKKGFYDGVFFHRVIPGFVAQTGDPTATGYGGPGFSQRCENNRLTYTRGMVGMALAGRDTGGSQFFINTTRQPHLDRHYPIFAEVIKGMDVVDNLTPHDVIHRVDVSRETLE